MKHYLYHRADGVIHCKATCADSAEPEPLDGLTLLLLDGPLDGNDWHVEGGAVVAGALDLRTLDDRKAEKWAAIRAERDAREAAGFPYLGTVFDSDPRAAQRISIAAQAAGVAAAAGVPFAIDWTAQDNSSVPLDAAQMLGMPVALATHANTLHQTARALREQIDAATTPEDLEEITWPQ